MNDLDVIKQRIPIEDLAESLGIKVINHVAKCPFHSDDNPSLHFSPGKNLFHCFGCSVGGDVFDLLMRKENIDFSTAVRKLCDLYNIPTKTSLNKYRHLCSKQNGLDLAYQKYKLKADSKKLISWAHSRNIDVDILQKNGALFLPGNGLISQTKEITRVEWEAFVSAGIIFKNFVRERED